MRLYIKITLLMLTVSLLPLILMGIISFTTVESTTKKTTFHGITTLTNEIGNEVWRVLNASYRNILLLAQNPVIRSPESSLIKQEQELLKTHDFHQIFKDITLLNIEGKVRASVHYSFIGSWKATEWFKTASEGKSIFSNVHAVLYPHDVVMTVATPVFDVDRNLSGVLVGQLDMDQIWQITGNVPIGETGEVFIIDQDGMVVAAPDPDLLLEPIQYKELLSAIKNNEMGIIEIEDTDDKKVAGYVQISVFGDDSNVKWTVVIMQSQKEVYASLYKARYGLLFTGIACLLVVSILSFLLSSRFTKRIKKLVEASSRLGKGEYLITVDDPRKDEIGVLGRSFNWTIKQLAFSRRRSEEAEDALRKAHDELENHVKERTNELAQANERLKHEVQERRITEIELRQAKVAAEGANRAKSEFLANMSHELRTPLNHIIGFSEMILEKQFGELNEKQEEYLTDVLTSSKHLLLLINDILDLSKVEAGKLELDLKELNLTNLLKNSLRMVSERAVKHGIQLSTDLNEIPQYITADERKLKQIMYNLLSNAVKFTPDGGSVLLKSKYPSFPEENEEYKENGFVKISVTDTGIGIKSEDTERIFSPFEQVESSKSRRFHGTGLGLSLTKKLVEAHGGKIWAESEGEGKGSTFSILIPT